MISDIASETNLKDWTNHIWHFIEKKSQKLNLTRWRYLKYWSRILKYRAIFIRRRIQSGFVSVSFFNLDRSTMQKCIITDFSPWNVSSKYFEEENCIPLTNFFYVIWFWISIYCLSNRLKIIFLLHGWFGNNGFSSLKQENFCIPRVQKENFCIPRALRALGMQKISFWTLGMQKSTCFRDVKTVISKPPMK